MVTLALLRVFSKKNEVVPRAISLLGLNLNETQLELDSHADTCALGKNALIIQDYMRPVDVVGYDPLLGASTHRTVSGVLRYTHPRTGKYYHLMINQAIYI